MTTETSIPQERQVWEEERRNLQDIKDGWENSEMWEEKQDVFDFMNEHFEYLLKKASEGYDLKDKEPDESSAEK